MKARPNLPRCLSMAFGFLTVLPFPDAEEWSDTDFGYASLFYPLAGAVIGALTGLGLGLLRKVFPGQTAALIALILWIVLSGGLHWDGLADCADGFCYAGTAEKRLSIMKDSRLGTFGGIALVLSILLKWQALTGLAPEMPLLRLALIAAASRWGMLLLLKLPLANPNGMAAELQRNCPPRVLPAALPVPLALALLSGIQGLALLGLSLLLPALLGLLAKRKIGGINGDVLGCSIELTEMILLLCAGLLQ